MKDNAAPSPGLPRHLPLPDGGAGGAGSHGLAGGAAGRADVGSAGARPGLREEERSGIREKRAYGGKRGQEPQDRELPELEAAAQERGTSPWRRRWLQSISRQADTAPSPQPRPYPQCLPAIPPRPLEAPPSGPRGCSRRCLTQRLSPFPSLLPLPGLFPNETPSHVVFVPAGGQAEVSAPRRSGDERPGSVRAAQQGRRRSGRQDGLTWP